MSVILLLLGILSSTGVVEFTGLSLSISKMALSMLYVLFDFL